MCVYYGGRMMGSPTFYPHDLYLHTLYTCVVRARSRALTTRLHQETWTKVRQALQAVRACKALAPFSGLSPKCQQEKIYPCIALNNLCARKYTYSMIVHPCKYFHSHSTVNWNMLYKLY